MNRQRSLLGASILSLSLLATAGVSADESSAKSAEKPKAAASAKAKTEKSSPLQGKFKYAGTDAEKDAKDKAVNDKVYSFDQALWARVKEKLDVKTKAPAWLNLKQSGSKVIVHFEGRKVEECSLEGPTDGMDPDGNPAELRIRRDGPNLIQTVTTAEGARVNTFQPQNDGSIKVHVELQSPQFKTPLKYTLTYRPAK